MRIMVLLLCVMPAFCCLNDAQTPRSEAEFRAQYADLPPAPVSEESRSVLSGTGWLVLGTGLGLCLVAFGARWVRDRA